VAELLKNGGEAVIDWLCELLQTVWRTRQVTSERKSSTLLPLHKKNDRKVCNNYSGISLLNVPGKVLALILFEWLQAIIEAQLMDTQCCFRKGRHTICHSNQGDSSGSGKSERVANPSVSLFC